MGWATENLQIPKELKDAILSGKCVAFIGCGVSAKCYGLWHDLVNDLCKRCGSNHRVSRDSPAEKFLDAAQNAKDRDEDVYYTFLGERFGCPADTTFVLYDILLSLPFECYLTVNFDPLLAIKAQTASKKCSWPVRAYPSLDRKAMTNRTIHYLHGMINEGEKPARGTIVLAREEFEEAYGNNSSLMNCLVPTFEHDAVVFIGCRLQEPVMKRVFAICKEHQLKRQQAAAELGQPSTNPPSRFIMLAKPEMTVDGKFDQVNSEAEMEKQEVYYKEMEIEPVWYTGSGTDHTVLRKGLAQMANLPDIRPIHGWEGGSPYDK